MPARRSPIPGRRGPGAAAYPVCVKDANFSISQAVTEPYCTADDTFALPFAAAGQSRPDASGP